VIFPDYLIIRNAQPESDILYISSILLRENKETMKAIVAIGLGKNKSVFGEKKRIQMINLRRKLNETGPKTDQQPQKSV